MTDLCLPGDIIQEICFHFRPRVDNYFFLTEKENRQTLKSISLASKVCYNASQPMLLHTIAFRNTSRTKGWYELLARLLAHPHSANLVREIIVPFTMEREAVLDICMPALAMAGRNFRFWTKEIETAGPVLRFLRAGMRKHDYEAEKILLVCLCTKVRRVTCFQLYDEAKGVSVDMTQRFDPKISGPGSLLPLLKSIDIQPDSLGKYNQSLKGDMVERLASMQPSSPLLQFLMLTSLELCGLDFIDFGHYYRTVLEDLYGQMPHVRHLQLGNCMFSPLDFWMMLDATPSLECLCVTGEHT